MGTQRYLAGLTDAIRVVRDQSPDIRTLDFTVLCDHILHVMDFLGPVMYFAKYDMSSKNDSLKRAAAAGSADSTAAPAGGGGAECLVHVVEADRAANRLTVKGSCARNLHRLNLVIQFVKLVFVNLSKDPAVLLKDAIYQAYEGSLASIHTYMVRTAVWAGLYMLPTKESFFKSIGESHDSARHHAAEFIAAADGVVAAVEALFGADTIMPPSDLTYIPTTVPTAPA